MSGDTQPKAGAHSSRGELHIESLQNERIKNVVKLRERSFRDRMKLLIVEDIRELETALANNRIPQSVFYCRDFFSGKNERQLIEKCSLAGAETISCSPQVFAKMAYREHPEGLLALVPQLEIGLADLKLSQEPLIVVAEAVEKPGNLGTILRSADAAGVDAVILCDRGADINNPNVVRASVGAVFTVQVAGAYSEKAIKWLRENKIQILAATPHADLEYTQADLTRGTAIVVGREQEGLSELWMKSADSQVRIPMRGKIDSLNVSAATTLLLFEALRQRQSIT